MRIIIFILSILLAFINCSKTEEEPLGPADGVPLLTWQTFYLPAGYGGNLTFAVAVNSESDIFAGQNDGRVLRHIEADTIWKTVKELWNPISFISINSHDSIFVGYFPSSTFLSGGVYSSDDNGDTWSKSYQNVNGIWDIAFYNNFYYVVSNKSIARSSDGGQNWNEFSAGLEDLRLRAIAADQSNGFLFVGSWGNGIYRSTDNGVTWNWNAVEGSYMDPLYSTANGYVFAAPGDGLYRTKDHGESWKKISILNDSTSSPDVFVRCMRATSQDNLLVGTDKNGLFLSMDYGKEWHNLGLKGIQILSLDIDKQGFVYVGVDSLRVLKSNESIIF